MDAQDWRDWAEVFRAGANRTIGWHNPAAPVLGAALDAMAAQCDLTADACQPEDEPQ